MFVRNVSFFSGFLVLLCFFPFLRSSLASQENAITIITPTADSVVITKYPNIQVQFRRPVDQESFIILLDDTDITATADITEQGFECRSPIILSAGSHTLYIAGNNADGYFEEEVIFSSRQYNSFEEASSSNEWTMDVQFSSNNFSHEDTSTTSILDSTFSSESTLKKGNLQVSLTGNARLLQDNSGSDFADSEYGPEEVDQEDGDQLDSGEQAQDSLDPEQQGFDLNTVLLRTQYQNDSLTAAVEIGDLQVEASENTFPSLARNGGQVFLEYHNLFLGGFSVFGTDTFGIRDGLGIGFDQDNHLSGVSAGVHLLEDRIELKTFYIDGGQQDNSYSSWSQEPGNSGNVYGAVFKTSFFDSGLETEFEFDQSDFDDDTTDSFQANSDEAYRAQVSGRKDIFSYGLSWEHFGLHYDIPGNLSPKKDYEGLTASGGVQLENQSIDLSLSGYHDNVESDPLYAQVNSLEGRIGYYYDGFEEFPVSLTFQHTRDQSDDEPEDSTETAMDTDTVSVGLGYAGADSFTLDFNTDYSWQDDKGDEDMDIATLSFILSPSLTFERFSINMTGGLNQNRDFISQTRNDDYTLTLDAMGTLFEDVVSYEFGGTYDHSLYTDDSGNQHSTSGYGRVAWHLPWLVETMHPSLGLELEYNRDKEQDSEAEEETRIFCTLSTAFPFSL